MATVASSLLFRACLAWLTVSSISIGRAAAVPHAHGDVSEANEHAGRPPHFHLNWLYGTRPVAGSPVENRSGANLADDAASEADEIYLVDIARSTVKEPCQGLGAKWSSCTIDVSTRSPSPISALRALLARRIEPDDSDIYLSVMRLQI